MSRIAAIIVSMFALLLTACADRDPVAPLASDVHAPRISDTNLPPPGARGITVMTRNLYIGTDVDPILGATSFEEALALVAQAWGTVVATNFPERAAALAREIAETRPHLIGLQELARYQMRSPSALLGGTGGFATVYDFLEILQAALQAQGLTYVVGAVQELSDVVLPLPTGADPPLVDLRFTEREAILVRGDVAFVGPRSGVFDAKLTFNVAGTSIDLIRGWVSVDATVAGQTVRFTSTHLEVQPFAPVQRAQAQELLALLEDSEVPVVLVGDFNSAADGSQTPTYGDILEAGYFDVWNRTRHRDPGYTCCQAKDLRNEEAQLDQRLDIVFVRDVGGPTEVAAAGLAGSAQVTIVGDDPADRTAGGLWPSDHAGVVATLRLPALLASAPGAAAVPSGTPDL